MQGLHFLSAEWQESPCSLMHDVQKALRRQKKPLTSLPPLRASGKLRCQANDSPGRGREPDMAPRALVLSPSPASPPRAVLSSSRKQLLDPMAHNSFPASACLSVSVFLLEEATWGCALPCPAPETVCVAAGAQWARGGSGARDPHRPGFQEPKHWDFACLFLGGPSTRL